VRGTLASYLYEVLLGMDLCSLTPKFVLSSCLASIGAVKFTDTFCFYL